MRAHIHTDAVSLMVTAFAVFLVAHTMRVAGAYLAGHNMPGLGTALGGYFTLPGA